MLAIRDGIYKTLVRIANREDPNQTASTVCQSLFGGQLVFKILEHLLYQNIIEIYKRGMST